MKNKTINAFYLYADKHVKVVYSVRHPIHGRLNHVEVYERLTDYKDFYMSGLKQGRIVFHGGGLFAVLRDSKALQVYTANDSEALTKRGLHCQSLYIHTDSGEFSVYSVDSLLSGGFTIQDVSQYDEKFNPELKAWSDTPVAKIHRSKLAAEIATNKA